MAAGGLTGAARVLRIDLGGSLALSPGALLLFALLYVLGYLLYSSLYAALGAAFNTADEAQYWSFILTLPLVFAGMLSWSLFAQAGSTMAVALSLVPPLAPVIMSMRIAVGAAPGWQIGLSLALMVVAIYAAWALSARIYRIGTLCMARSQICAKLPAGSATRDCLVGLRIITFGMAAVTSTVCPPRSIVNLQPDGTFVLLLEVQI